MTFAFFGVDRPIFTLQEIPEIAAQRQISALCARQRGEKLAALEYFETVEVWKRGQQQNIENAREANRARIVEKSQETKAVVLQALEKRSKKLADICHKTIWKVLGFRGKDGKTHVVLHPKEMDILPVVVWASKGLQRILDQCIPLFQRGAADKYGRELFWLVDMGVGELGGLEIEIEPTQTFQNKQGVQISWNPIRVHTAPDPQRLGLLQALGAKCEEMDALRKELEKNTLQKIPPPPPKDTQKVIELPPGEYVCSRFATSTFRGSSRTILFLRAVGEDVEIPTHGFFFEREVEAMGGATALERRRTLLRCRLGAAKTTMAKRKCHQAALV